MRESLDFHDGVGPDDQVGSHVVEDLQHRKKLAVLRDPGGEPFRVQDDGFNAFAHAASAFLEVPTARKIFE
ncbi:hypothetical protein SMICM17S_04512 [Streptomyces microflavus]